MDKELREMFDAQKASYRNGYESGWDDCLDDLQKQMRQKAQPGNNKKIVFQYYGVKEVKERTHETNI
jgi:hypothetical protein